MTTTLSSRTRARGRYVAASGIQEPAGIVRTVSNGSRDALAKRRKTKSLKVLSGFLAGGARVCAGLTSCGACVRQESSSIITDVPFGLGVRPTSHF